MTRNVLSRETVCLPKSQGGLGIPHIRLKCMSLFIKQMCRNILSRGNSKSHIDFWLGSRIGLTSLDSEMFHIKKFKGKLVDTTPDLFNITLKYFTDCYANGIFAPTDINSLTTKSIYTALLKEITPPVIVTKYPERDWSLIWQRLNSGVFTPETRSYIYLILHERVGTRERGHRLMPGRFHSPQCCRCGQEPETIIHRYQTCRHVSQVWEWVRNLMLLLDPCLSLDSDSDILSLNFSKGLRENSILWLLGIFIKLVESDVILKQYILNPNTVPGFFKQQKQKARHMAMPDLGIIPGLDFDQQGIG